MGEEVDNAGIERTSLGKVCIICNPTAGYGRSGTMLPTVEGFLSSHLIPYDVFKTTGPRHAVALASELCNSGYGLLVAMGGDGTLGEVVSGVLQFDSCRTTLGVIPSGTGNDFVAGSYFFSNWRQAMESLVNPEVVQVDVIKVTDFAGVIRYVINSVGFGYDAYVVKRVSRLGAKKVGKAVYLLEAVKGLFSFSPSHIDLNIDGVSHKLDKGWICAITNSEKMGGGMKVNPGANPYDSYLDTCFLQDVPRINLVGLLTRVFSGKHIGKPGVTQKRFKKFIIEAPQSYPCHLDGDVAELTYPVQVEILEQSLPFVVPGGYKRKEII